jgi:hypothetical protein
MVYVLGSETEALTFTEHGIDVRPIGLAHAVDPASELNSAGGVLAYAICGRAVRSWPDQTFDPLVDEAHRECATLVTSERQG